MMMMKTSMMYLMVWRAMISQDWQVFFRPALQKKDNYLLSLKFIED